MLPTDRKAGPPWSSERGGGSATAKFWAAPEPSAPLTDSQAGSPWALGGGSDTAELWAVPEPSAGHQLHSAEQRTTGRTHRGPARPSLETATSVTPRPRSGSKNKKIGPARAVTAFPSPTTWRGQMICGGRPASMRRAAVQRHVGGTMDISARVHTMLETLDAKDFVAFVPRGGAGVNLPLSQHLLLRRLMAVLLLRMLRPRKPRARKSGGSAWP